MKYVLLWNAMWINSQMIQDEMKFIIINMYLLELLKWFCFFSKNKTCFWMEFPSKQMNKPRISGISAAKKQKKKKPENIHHSENISGIDGRRGVF